MAPVRTGLALAITVGAFYAFCTVAWTISPATFLGVMNNLFHGMGFTGMVQPHPFDFPAFLAAPIVLIACALLAGMFFTWLQKCPTR